MFKNNQIKYKIFVKNISICILANTLKPYFPYIFFFSKKNSPVSSADYDLDNPKEVEALLSILDADGSEQEGLCDDSNADSSWKHPSANKKIWISIVRRQGEEN